MTREEYNKEMQELADRTPLEIIKNIDEMLNDDLSKDIAKVAVLSEVGNLLLEIEKTDDRELEKVYDYIESKAIKYSAPALLLNILDDILKGVKHED